MLRTTCRWWWVALAVSVTACSGDSRFVDDATTPPPSAPNPMTSTSTSTSISTTTSTLVAPVTSLGVRLDPPAQGVNTIVADPNESPLGVTADGLAIGVELGDPGCGAMYLLDPSTKTRSTIQLALPTGCPENATGTDRFVVWENDTATDLYLIDWHLMVHDRRSGQTKQIAQHPTDSAGNPVPGGWFYPEVDQKFVAWSAMTDAPPIGDHPGVFVADAETGSTTMVAADSKSASLSYPYLYYVRQPTTGGASSGVLVRRDLPTGDERELRTGQTEAVCFGRSFGLVRHACHRRRRHRAQCVVRGLTRSGSLPIRYPTCVDDHAVWENESGSWLFDARERMIRKLGFLAHANVVFSAGDWVLWTDTPGQLEGTSSAVYRIAQVTDLER